VNIKFLTFAQQEIDEAYLWFEESCAGKGLEYPRFFRHKSRRVVFLF